jgi:hypothetical protein
MLPRVFNVAELGHDGAVKDPTNLDEVAQKQQKAFEVTHYRGERIPVGIFYEIKLPTYVERMQAQAPMLKKYAPARVPYEDASHLPTTDLTKAYEEFLF